MTDPAKNPPEDPKPDDNATADPPEESQSPTDEELRQMYASGDLLTKDTVNELIKDRLDRLKETEAAKAAQEKATAEAEGKRKALADQEQYKELAESLTSDVTAKDARINELQTHEQRAKDLEERLTKVVDTRLQNLPKPYQDLLAKMPVEERADWLEANADLVKSGDGKPGGSPASPDPAPRSDTREEAERTKKAMSIRSYW